MLNQTIERGDVQRNNFCTIHCAELAHFSPHTMISPTERDPILLKTHGTQIDERIRSQTLYPTELRARGTLLTISSLPQFLLRFQPRVVSALGGLRDMFWAKSPD
jgi:hypothetical protein